MQWFRFYSEVLHDPKVQRLPARLFKIWINLLCIANENAPRGQLPPEDDLIFALRLPEENWQSISETLIHAGLIDATPEGLRIHGWDARQYKSDEDPTHADRQRRYRQRRVTDAQPSLFRMRDASLIRPDPDTDPDPERETSPRGLY